MITSIRKLPRRWHARILLLVVGVTAVGLAIPHLGTSSRPSLVSTPPEASSGPVVASVTAPNGPAELHLAQTIAGTSCLSVSLPDLGRNAGGVCAASEALETRLAGKALTVSMSWAPGPSGVVLAISGRAGASIGSVAVELQDGTHVPAALDSSRGLYVSRVSAPAVGKLPGAIAVDGYSPAGTEIARLDLQSVLAASTPR